MQKTWRFFSFAATISMMFFFAGCMTHQTTTMITQNGSGTNEMIFGLAKEVIQQMGEDPFADFTEEMGTLPEGWQGTLAPWEDDKYKGVKLSLKFSDLNTLKAQLNRILGPEAETNSGSAGILQNIDVKQDGNNVIINATLKKDKKSESGNNGMFSDFKITWSIEMPSIEQFTEQSIATQQGNRVTWNFPFVVDRDYAIEVRGTLIEGTSRETPATPKTTPSPQSSSLPGERCFSEVPNCITGRIRQYWEKNGGLTVFGFPITPQQEETIEGKPYQVQWFQRNRMELHPENQVPYDVLLGRLGVQTLEKHGRDWQQFAKSATKDGCIFFAETGHNICGNILSSWKANGLETDGVIGSFSTADNIALFGLPISDEMTETLSDGKQYTVQYFERARFELHPENQPPYNVLIGLLGNEVSGK